MELDNFKYNLSRLKKCNQYWDGMKPVTGGRLCSKCEKKIVDFSNMSFTDIAFYMAESKEPVCGFYLPEQLEQIKSSTTKLPLAISLTTLLTTSTVVKAENKHERIEQNVVDNKLLQGSDLGTSGIGNGYNIDTVYLTGNIQSFDTAKKINVPVSYAAIIIKGTQTGVSTMVNGDFRLPYVTTADSGKIYLVISSVGLETKELAVNYTGQKQIELGTITLMEYDRRLTEFYVNMKRPGVFRRYWRKITKPFR
jgi:hypothetical protein